MSAPDPMAMPHPDRIALVGDWHGNASWARKAVRHAATGGAQAIVHLGDYGYEFRAPFMHAVEDVLSAFGIPLLFVDGNHESFPVLHRHPVRPNGLRKLTDHVWHAPRGHRWTWHGVSFLAMGGAHSVDRPHRQPGISWWKEEWITDAQAQAAIDGEPVDVLVSHDCPAGVTIPGIDDRDPPDWIRPMELLRAGEHRRIVRRIVDAVQPRVIWHGHYHQAHTTTADLGYGNVRVTGLDCDESTLADNVRVIDVKELLP